MGTNATYDFFLAHASPDKSDVAEYADMLRERGATVAFDKDEIAPGQDWVDRVLDLLDVSSVGLIFVSQHSEKALVQGLETFLFRYFARKNPGHRVVVPIFLPGAPAKASLIGLETTSGFREDQTSRHAIADELIKVRDRLGDAAQVTMRTVRMIDDLALRWLFPGHSGDFGGRFELDGTTLRFLHHDVESGRLTRDEFANELSDDELELVTHLEAKMDRLYREWKVNDLDSVTSEDAEGRAREFARRLGEEVAMLLEMLWRHRFQLDDHYEHIRSVVARYYGR